MTNTILTDEMKEQGFIQRRYRNYKGEVAVRTFMPIGLIFKHSDYHSKGDEKVWILSAFDFDKQDYRDFAFNDFLED